MQSSAWIVAVDMGYGHERALYPLRHLSPTNHLMVANDYEGIPDHDKKLWQEGRAIYEKISRLNNLPFIGSALFSLFDRFQAVPSYAPNKVRSMPSLQGKQNQYLIKRGWGRHLIEQLNQKQIPLITSFFTVAFMAEEHGFKDDIYLLICDTDISRAWAPINPAKSRVNYCAPTEHVVDRLRSYGVPANHIFLTGFPLPAENTGSQDSDILKTDLLARLQNLDPTQKYLPRNTDFFKTTPAEQVVTPHPLTLTFAIGGAGAQQGIAGAIISSLKDALLKKKIRLNLVAGTRPDTLHYLQEHIHAAGLESQSGTSIHLIFAPEKEAYFNLFNKALRTTDALWTKPSELVFYSALGIPIIMAPALGSQEQANRRWLQSIGAGHDEGNPAQTETWLQNWIQSGRLATMANAGYTQVPQSGLKSIEKIIFPA